MDLLSSNTHITAHHTMPTPSPQNSPQASPQTPNKKLALLYHGVPSPRAMHLCHQSHLSALRDHNPSWDIDVFAHLFCPTHATHKTYGDTLYPYPWPYGMSSLTQLVTAMWRPKGLVIEHPPSPETYHTQKDNTPPHTTKAWDTSHHHDIWTTCAAHAKTLDDPRLFWCDVLTAYAIDIANTLTSIAQKKDAITYDGVLCMRVDVMFAHKSAVILPETLSQDILIPDDPWLTTAFALGTQASMDAYGTFFTALPSLLTASSPPPPMMKHHLNTLTTTGLHPIGYRHDNVPDFYLYDEKEKSLQQETPQHVLTLQRRLDTIKKELHKAEHAIIHKRKEAPQTQRTIKELENHVTQLKDEIVALYHMFDNALPAQQWSTTWRKEHF